MVSLGPMRSYQKAHGMSLSERNGAYWWSKRLDLSLRRVFERLWAERNDLKVELFGSGRVLDIE